MRASRAVRDMVERAGGTALVNRVGHAFFKTRMREIGAAFGGEVSGHYYFRDFYCADSGTLPALLILELLSQKGQDDERADGRRSARSTSSPARSTPRSTTSRPRCDEIKEKLLRRRDHRARRRVGRLRRTGTSTCGPSNTEPLLRLNLESLVSREHMEEKRDEVLALIRG